MTAIRVAKRKRWTTIDRGAVNDDRLSFRARGVLVWLLDKPDDWNTDSLAIARAGREGRDAVRAALAELRECGYLAQARRQIEGGRWITETLVFEAPTPDFQASVNRASVDQAITTEELTPRTDTETTRAFTDPLDAEFSRWWEEYPRAAGKVDARNAYEAARKRGASAEELLLAAKHYAAERDGEEPKFTKHAATFLRQDRWREHLEEPDEDGPDRFGVPEGYRSEADMLRDVR